ncbi:TauD/TfdA dioxygenase family protein [Hydrogenophaga sp. BPS33]|uniref:TauD/TfdA dioxygenase family protein n=1 Tax=Hydrogenophaga sp. BPS33 TaxID=2651974 RepID=UPI0013201A66|nr:TauD/TfdA family dioxygenase [Hydrogenophaga sp. BPS33]QHE83705.1 TauD/TfdA family dioxygenase [Hydrogenophaga sp. BPS33]
MKFSIAGTLELAPLSRTFGVDVLNVSAAECAADAQLQALLRAAIARHLLLRFPEQDVTPDEALALTAAFGPLMDLRSASHVPGRKFLQVLSNGIAANGQRCGDGNNSAQIWHTDAGQWEVPPGVSVFYGVITPPSAPKNGYKNMIQVYEALPQRLKERIAPLRAVHHMYPRSVDVLVHQNGASLPREQREIGQLQPLVRRHLGSGAPILYLPSRRDSVVPGLSDAESRELLEELWAFTNQQDCDWIATTRRGDLVIFDNTALVHNREGWPTSERRDIWHLVTEGEAVTPMFTRTTLNLNSTASVVAALPVG